MAIKFKDIVRSRTAIGTLSTSGVFGVRLLLQAASLLLLTRMLGAQSFGFFAAIASAALLFGTVSTLGLHLTLLRDFSSTNLNKGKLLNEALGTTASCGAICFALYLTIVITLFDSSSTDVTAAIFIGLSETLIQPLLLISIQERIAKGRPALAQLFLVAPLFLRTSLAAIIYINHSDSPLLLYSIAYLGSAALTLAASKSTHPTRWPRITEWRLINKERVRDVKGYALFGFTYRANTEIDKILASQVLTMSSAGSYAAASRAVGALATPINALIQSILPNLFKTKTSAQSQKLHSATFFLSLTYGGIAAAAMFLLSPWLADLFGPGYADFETYLQGIALAVPALSLRLTGCSILMTTGHVRLRNYIELSSIFILILSSFTLAVMKAPLALPISFTLAELWGASASWYIIRKDNLALQKNRT